MGPTTISVTAAGVLTVLQPYLPLIATQTAEQMGKELPATVGKLWAALRARLAAKPAAHEAANDLLEDPQDADRQAALRVQLKKLLQEDEAFASQLAALLAEAQEQTVGFQATLHGGGAIAQGPGATAVGERGVYIGGEARDNQIVTGDDNEAQKSDK